MTIRYSFGSKLDTYQCLIIEMEICLNLVIIYVY